MLKELRNLDVDGADLDEAVALLTVGRLVKVTFTENKMEPPEWMIEKLDYLEKHIKAKRIDNITRALKEAQARRAALATAEEKRSKEDAKIAELEAALKAG